MPHDPPRTVPWRRGHDPVRATALWSLVAQVVLGLVGLWGVFVPSEGDLRTILLLETVSQTIEFSWYAYIVLGDASPIETWTRYLDWVVSTPTMLVSTVMFFRTRARADHRVGALFEPAWDEGLPLYGALVANWGMLAVGRPSAASPAWTPRCCSAPCCLPRASPP